MKKTIALILISIMILAVFAGCQNTEKATASTDSTKTESTELKPNTILQPSGNAVQETQAPVVDPQTTYKDTIIFVTASDQNVMDGQMNNTNEKILRSVYSSLVRKDAVTNELVGDLAESWEVSEDGCVWTFHLRKDVTFHNGKQFTAKDVKASYDRLLNKEKPVRYTSTMALIKECNVVDDYTVTLSTEVPFAAMLPNLLHRANLILDADYIEKYGADLGLTLESVNGTGPYKMTVWNPGEVMEMEAFDGYYDDKALTKHLVIQIMPEASSRAISLESGECDIADGLTVEDITRFIDMDGFHVAICAGNGTHLYQFNCANQYLADKRVRQAILYAVDMESIVKVLYGPKGETICDAPLNPNVWGYSSIGVIPHDVDKAKALLAEAGYPDGFDMSIMLLPTYDKALESAEMIVEQLKAVGINATIDVVEKAVFNDAFKQTKKGENFPWAMFIMGQGPGTCDADGMRRYYSYEGETNANNYGWYENEEVTELLEKAAAELDEAKRLEMYKRIQEIVWLEDPAAMWMNNRNNFYCMSNKVEGFHVDIRNAVDFRYIRIAE